MINLKAGLKRCLGPAFEFKDFPKLEKFVTICP